MLGIWFTVDGVFRNYFLIIGVFDVYVGLGGGDRGFRSGPDLRFGDEFWGGWDRPGNLGSRHR